MSHDRFVDTPWLEGRGGRRKCALAAVQVERRRIACAEFVLPGPLRGLRSRSITRQRDVQIAHIRSPRSHLVTRESIGAMRDHDDSALVQIVAQDSNLRDSNL